MILDLGNWVLLSKTGKESSVGSRWVGRDMYDTRSREQKRCPSQFGTEVPMTACNAGAIRHERRGFDSWVGKIPWRRE